MRALLTMWRTTLISVVLAVAVTGCKGPCRALSEKLCDCSLNSIDKTGCLQRASAAESSNPPTAEDDQTCRELYDQCDCRLIDTAAGKVRCGLARGSVATAPADAGTGQ